MSEEVFLVPYDPEWPELYESERVRILAEIGDTITAIEHVGSTAVPGISAKPIIDVMVGVDDIADAELCIAPLQSLGFVYRPELEDVIPERRFFELYRDDVRMCHVHVVEIGPGFWEDHLLFRDYLRSNPDVAAEYEALKQRLANEHRHDRYTYSDSKTGFIRRVEARARAEREGDVDGS